MYSWNVPLSLYAKIALAILALLAAGWDIKTRTIPNWLTVTAAVIGIALGWQEGLKGLGLGLLLQLPFFVMGMIGGGDVKLMAAAGAIAGWKNLVMLFFLSTALQGIIALVVLAVTRGKARGVPRGPSFALAVGLLLILLS